MTRTGSVKNQIRNGDSGYLRTHYMDLAQILMALEDTVIRCEVGHRKMTSNMVVSALERYETIVFKNGVARTADEEQDEVVEVQSPFQTKKQKMLEPFVVGGTIGLNRYYCKTCKTQVERRDVFCRRCGRKFTEEEDLEDNG